MRHTAYFAGCGVAAWISESERYDTANLQIDDTTLAAIIFAVEKSAAGPRFFFARGHNEIDRAWLT
jgi:hypothetical protein